MNAASMDSIGGPSVPARASPPAHPSRAETFKATQRAERAEKAYEKHAWIIFFVLGFLAAFASRSQLLGMSPNPPSPEVTTGLTMDQIATRIPGIVDYIGSIDRQLGNFMLATGVLVIAIAAVPYRRGEKWAWYTCWTIPILVVIQLANSFLSTPGGGLGWQLDFAFIFVALVALLMPYRKFFAKK